MTVFLLNNGGSAGALEWPLPFLATGKVFHNQHVVWATGVDLQFTSSVYALVC